MPAAANTIRAALALQGGLDDQAHLIAAAALSNTRNALAVLAKRSPWASRMLMAAESASEHVDQGGEWFRREAEAHMRRAESRSVAQVPERRDLTPAEEY